MHPFLDFFIKTNGLLLFFWLFYRLFLHKETFYTANRWYLLGSIAISLVAPLITFTKTVFIEAPKPTIDWDTLATMDRQNTIVEENLFTVENFAIVIIGLISTILVLKTLFQLNQTYRKIKKLPYDTSLQVRRSSNETIFSLYPHIVVPNHFEKIPNSEMILSHEQVHIQQKHSIDMIFMQLIRSVFWMNPLLRYLQKDIEVNLEYIVDEYLQTQFDSKTYQLSLLSFHSTTPLPFVNSFNSQLKKRILQINSKKSNPMKKLKMFLAAPAIVAFFTLFQIETQAQVIESLIVEKVTENDKLEEDSFNVMIHPSYDNAYYERIQKMLNEKYSLDVKFSNLKRNENGELTSIKISCNNKEQLFVKSFQSIDESAFEPFSLAIRKENNRFIIGVLTKYKLQNDVKDNIVSENKTKNNTSRIIIKTPEEGLKKYNYNIKRMFMEEEIDHDTNTRDIIIYGDYVYLIDNKISNVNNFVKILSNTEYGNFDVKYGKEHSDKLNINGKDGVVTINKNISSKENSITNETSFTQKTTETISHLELKDTSENKISEDNLKKILYIVNGKEMNETDFRTIKPDDIESITVLKDKNATDKYGVKGKDGVLEIQLKEKKS